ncbi:hypothetical protein ACFV0T_26735 [Streptomyces sp. NPDC059582]|uniref:hypothetical protein n=1 Tax=Streptomyces sp. NPDC059582 TaxID=3346875 RepID=UPI003696DE62
MDIGRELVQLRSKLEEVERAARLRHASLDNNAIIVKDEAGTVRGHIGMQADGTIGLIAVDGPAPGAPSAPAVTPSLGGLRIAWNGQLADGSPLPADFDHVAVHISTSSGFTPSAATFVGTITRAGDGGMLPVTPLPYLAHFVVLTAVNTSAAASGPSSQVMATPLKVDGPDLTAGSVTAAAIHAGAVTADKLEAILEIATRLVAGDPAGARVELNEDGLRVYNGSGTLVIRFDAADGSAVFTGAITASTISGTTITGGTISGTTVTGGLIQTATSGERISLNELAQNKILVYNAAGTAINELSARGLLVKGSSGAVIWLDPNATYPSMKLYNAAGTNAAVIDLVEPVTGDANLEMLSGSYTVGSYTAMRWRSVLQRDAAVIERYNQVSPFPKIGGRLFLSDTIANLGFQNDDNTPLNTGFTVSANLAAVGAGRFSVTAPASTFSACYVEADAAHTGNMLRLFRGADKFLVDKDGNTTAAGSLNGTTVNVTDTTWQTYTPTVAGQGTGTFTSRTGFYFKLGKLVFFQAEFVMNAAGTGTGTITVTAPSNIYRTGGRQTIPCHAQSTTTSGAVMNGHAVALETGTGAVIDRISVSNDGTTNRDNVLNGANLLTGARVTIEGWYREA